MAVLSAISGMVGAQTVADFKKMPPGQKAQFITDSLKVALDLSPVQADKVHTELLADVQKIMPVANGNESRMARREEMKAFLATEEAKLKKILTPAQFALFEKKKENALNYYRTHLFDRKIVFNVPQ
jgi:hypothetical protein